MKQDKSTLTSRTYAIPFVMVTLLFFLWGFARAILDVLNKHLQNQMDITIAHSALIQVTTYLGYFIMAIPAGMFINRYGYRRGAVLGLLLFGVGAMLFIPGAYIGTFGAFLCALFVIGCGLVFLETTANPYVTELGPADSATRRLNFSQSFNGLGSLFATLVVGQYLFGAEAHTDSVVLPYTILGILVLAIAAVFARVRLPEIQHAGHDTDALHGSRISYLLRHRHSFGFGLAALLCYEIAEISINSYFINYVTGMGWMTDRVASVVLTCALACFMVGRFGGSWLMRYITPRQMLTGCAVGTVVCMALVLADMGTVSMVALVANYLFESIMFPTIFALALTGLGDDTKTASSLLMMTPIGGCGFLLMGLTADHVGLTLPFAIPLTAFAVVLVYALSLRRR